ncbi:MAG: hypothetical protein QOD74_2497, partial [Variibacter sp.]|nr:hypothetical protein [Variibacter sp.]
MTLSSMTGFARADGVTASYSWSWELKSVNGKGLDLRVRMPAGWDGVEVAVRERIKPLARGTIYANLSVKRENAPVEARINADVLNAVLSAMQDVAGKVDATAPSLDGVLAIKGVMEIGEREESQAEREAAEADVLNGFDRALATLIAMRAHEGRALASLLNTRLDEIERLAARADAAPGRQPAAIKARLTEQIEALMESSNRLDPDRLHQEALLLATKVDVREELDRLAAHIGQARTLLREGGPVGRRLDFLSQEFNREVNTLCAKSNDVELTTIGLELKHVVEQ